MGGIVRESRLTSASEGVGRKGDEVLKMAWDLAGIPERFIYCATGSFFASGCDDRGHTRYFWWRLPDKNHGQAWEERTKDGS